MKNNSLLRRGVQLPETFVSGGGNFQNFFQISDRKMTNFGKSKLTKFEAKSVKSNQNWIKIIQISCF